MVKDASLEGAAFRQNGKQKPVTRAESVVCERAGL